MRVYRRLSIIAVSIFIILAAILNIVLFRSVSSSNGSYRVEAKRLSDEIEETGGYDLAKYSHITAVYSGENLYQCDEQYLIIEAAGKLYRVEYIITDSLRLFLILNLILLCVFILILGLLLYIRYKIIVPFGRLRDVPKELAKGNLAVPIPEEKSRFFGNFTWGVNLLREKIEDDRRRELAMQRDKKLLLLSLSHDIKTPLSAIKLNAKALEKGIYSDEEKCRAAAASINSRADEIEHFVSEITKAASEDFMSFEVVPGEVFLSEIITKIYARYSAQLESSGTNFSIQKYNDCILSCDAGRLEECLQNLIENAIKYGDGRQIDLGFQVVDNCELITVTNTGCTLEEKELTQIFGSFHRGSNSEKVQGNGLGLYICKRLMTLMGGEAYAEINGECFSVTLVVKLA